jgi:hypothetical protein
MTCQWHGQSSYYIIQHSYWLIMHVRFVGRVGHNFNYTVGSVPRWSRNLPIWASHLYTPCPLLPWVVLQPKQNHSSTLIRRTVVTVKYSPKFPKSWCVVLSIVGVGTPSCSESWSCYILLLIHILWNWLISLLNCDRLLIKFVKIFWISSPSIITYSLLGHVRWSVTSGNIPSTI